MAEEYKFNPWTIILALTHQGYGVKKPIFPENIIKNPYKYFSSSNYRRKRLEERIK